MGVYICARLQHSFLAIIHAGISGLISLIKETLIAPFSVSSLFFCSLYTGGCCREVHSFASSRYGGFEGGDGRVKYGFHVCVCVYTFVRGAYDVK